MEVLSKRLSLIADLVPESTRVCDVGTDHGYLAIHLLKSGKASKVIATDINEKPLNKARQNIERAELEGISLRLCDGLEGVVSDEFDTVVIAGIGGEVISGILKRAEEKVRGKALVFQPTTSPEALRKYLCDNGFEILKEVPLCENGKLYSVMLCEYTGVKSEKEIGFYFSGLVSTADEDGKMYIEKQKSRCLKCALALQSIEEKAEEYRYYKSALDYLNKL